PFLGLGRGPVVDRDLMAALFHEVSRHRETHHAETEKSDFSHVCYLVICLGFDLGFCLEALPARSKRPAIRPGREGAPYRLRSRGQRLRWVAIRRFVLGWGHQRTSQNTGSVWHGRRSEEHT